MQIEETKSEPTTLMELLPDDVCALCGENTAVLSAKVISPYVKYITKTFFDKSEQGLREFQEITATENFCVLCSHKVIISQKFKNGYEDRVKKQTSFKKSSVTCFLCEAKTDLISPDTNPNDFNTKIKTFMNCSLFPRPYIQCAVCFGCIFSLNIWFEIYSSLMKKLNMEEVLTKLLDNSENMPNKSLQEIETDSFYHAPILKNRALNKDKENVTPPSESKKIIKRVRIQDGSPAREMPRKFNRLSTMKASSNANLNQIITNEVQSLSEKLNNELKHLKTVKEINNIVQYPTDILDDTKMLNEIPYVLINRDGKQADVGVSVHTSRKLKKIVQVENKSDSNTRRSGRINKPPEIIELSDDEETANGEEEIDTDVAVKHVKKGNQNNKKDTSSSQFTVQKSPLKIRLSKKFVFNSEPKISKKKVSTALKRTKHICNICDATFSLVCDFKCHTLWHEKPEKLSIELTRYQLPKHAKASQFVVKNKPKVKTNVNFSKISKLVMKYTGESSSNVFEDLALDMSVNEGDIENLDSQPDNEKYESNEKVKEVEVDEQNQEVENLHNEDIAESNKSVSESGKLNELVPEEENTEISQDADDQTEKLEMEDKDEKIITSVHSDHDPQNTNENSAAEESSGESEISQETAKQGENNVYEPIEVASDSDRTSVGEPALEDEQVEENEKENLVESDTGKEEDDQTSNIEKVLAELHGEIDDHNESEGGEKQSEDDGCNESGEGDVYNEGEEGDIVETNGIDDASDNGISRDQDESETDVEDEFVDNVCHKRKRSCSYDEDMEKDSSDADTTHKAKRVRFAMDYEAVKDSHYAVNAVSDEDDVYSDTVEENTLRLSDNDNEKD